jgi:hypothetical protein
MKKAERASARFNQGKTLYGDLIRENEKTIVMRLDGGKTVKRHKRKHKASPGAPS